MNLNLQDYQLPGDKIAYIFSDASGTNACIAMMQLQSFLGKDQFLLYSNTNYFPDHLKPAVSNTVPGFQDDPVDLVFTGTSHPESSGKFEGKCIRNAKLKGITTISFIDHWINFALRFQGLSIEELPDEIWVIDERAAILAIGEGLPADKIKIKGNPYHFYLKSYWVSRFQNKNYLQSLSVPLNFFHVLFAPDPFSIRELHKRTGFTEMDALQDLLEILNSLENVFLLVKPHPLQPPGSLKNIFEEYPEVRYKLIEKADNCELINSCDLVVGFYSNLLLEARALNKRVIRYFPGNEDADLLKDSSYFNSLSRNRAELKENMLNAINERYSFPEGTESKS